MRGILLGAQMNFLYTELPEIEVCDKLMGKTVASGEVITAFSPNNS